MEKLEMRARARATARAAGLFDTLRQRATERALPERRGRAGPPAFAPIDHERARAACAAMGTLEFIVQAADATGRVRSLYVIVPDEAMSSHYERLGFTLEPGCHVLLDGAALRPLAVLRLSQAGPAPVGRNAAGFNPYDDLPAALLRRPSRSCT